MPPNSPPAKAAAAEPSETPKTTIGRPGLRQQGPALAHRGIRFDVGQSSQAADQQRTIGAPLDARVPLADALQGTTKTERTGLLTVGSSLLKIALHPAAAKLRGAVKAIVAADIPWLDVQSLTDILNFYGTKPAELIAGRSSASQNTTKVRFRNQLESATYRAIKRDFFRVHRQFVYGVERRSHYSYHAILCGPEPFADVVRRGGLRDHWSALGQGEGTVQ